MPEIVLNPDPASTHGATKAYREAWHAAYGATPVTPDPPDFKRAVYIGADDVPRIDADTTLLEAFRPEISDAVSASPSIQILKRAAQISAADYGAVGDGTIETAKLQALLSAAGEEKRQAVVPTPDDVADGAHYAVNAPLVIGSGGLSLSGQSNRYTTIRQTAANTDLLQLVGDPNNDTFPNTLSNVVIEDLDLRASVAGGTGKAINAAAAQATEGIYYNGNFLTLRRVRGRFFDVGLDLFHWDNSYFEQCSFRDGRIGVRAAGNANDLHFKGVMAAGSEVGWDLGDGQGSTITLNDSTSSPQMVRVRNLAKWTLIGGDFEVCEGGTEFVKIDGGGSLIAIGTRCIKGSGNDVPFARVANGGFLTWINPNHDGFTTSPAIIKESVNASVNVIGQKRTTQTIMVGEYSGATELTRYAAGAIDQNALDNGVPTPDANTRGRSTWIMGRDTAAKEDRPAVHVRKSDGTFELVDVIRSRTYHSLNGGSTAHSRKDGVKRYYGEVAVTTAAATYTDVSVTIPAFTNANLQKTLSALVLSGAGDVSPMSVARVSTTPASGIVTFRVFHASDTGGGKALKVQYDIEAVN